MIYSSINDNWMRVKLMHSIASDLYASTSSTDFRKRVESGGSVFPYDGEAYSTMENERRIVGMVMVWSVVTLESLVNHQIAATISNKTLATMAIEYPAQVIDKVKRKSSVRSELAKKLMILTDGSQPPVELADSLADTRNLIVHDKPCRLIDHGEGEISVEWFRSRGNTDLPTYRFEHLADFYADCDSIKDCAVSVCEEPLDCDINFGALIGV